MGGCLLFLFFALAWLSGLGFTMACHGVYGFALSIVLCHLSAQLNSRFQDLGLLFEKLVCFSVCAMQ